MIDFINKIFGTASNRQIKQYSKSVELINNLEKIEESIQKCLFDNITKKKLEEGRKEFLEKIISFQGNAAEKHVQISLKMINDAQKNE